MRTAQWIRVALLAPFWWGMGLLLLAFLADLFPSSRRALSAVFGNLERAARKRSTDSGDRVPVVATPVRI